MTGTATIRISRFPNMGVFLNHPFLDGYSIDKPAIWGTFIYGNPIWLIILLVWDTHIATTEAAPQALPRKLGLGHPAPQKHILNRSFSKSMHLFDNSGHPTCISIIFGLYPTTLWRWRGATALKTFVTSQASNIGEVMRGESMVQSCGYCLECG